MLVSDFDYGLPQELIAQQPLAQRDESRMMVVFRRDGKIVHSRFKEFPRHLNQDDVLVLNNTKVIPAKIWGQKDSKDIEFLLLREKDKGIWEVLCRPAKKVQAGDVIHFAPNFKGKILEAGAEGKRTLRFSSKDVLSELNKIGFPPLPPYIKRKKEDTSIRPLDLERYQTVFAQKEGAIAAPTAGLHFTPETLKKIQKNGIKASYVSLQVGLATFQPVRAEKVENHRMLEETYTVSRSTSQAINKAKEDSRPVVAVGTTVVRTLESAFQNGGVRAGKRTTSLFIYPGYEFKVVDRLLTNFHLPKSTLLMMVAAFAGLDLIKKAYREAICQKYRFYSYGDCMLIL
jgi:S-adenosylmethionine:tRNA ribosyltransferase-isomerase